MENGRTRVCAIGRRRASGRCRDQNHKAKTDGEDQRSSESHHPSAFWGNRNGKKGKRAHNAILRQGNMSKTLLCHQTGGRPVRLRKAVVWAGTAHRLQNSLRVSRTRYKFYQKAGSGLPYAESGSGLLSHQWSQLERSVCEDSISVGKLYQGHRAGVQQRADKSPKH